MKAKNCDDCEHYTWSFVSEAKCKLGHKLRFYKPKTLSDAHSGNFGYKRKCEDFKGVEQ